MSTTNAAQAARQELGPKFAGELVGPEDPGYEQARAVYNAMIDRRPALIARCAGPPTSRRRSRSHAATTCCSPFAAAATTAADSGSATTESSSTSPS